MTAPRRKMPRWSDGRRWCPDCQAYISPDRFARVAVSRSHPDGYRNYCRVHDLARGRLYRARKKRVAPRVTQRAYSIAVYTAHGRVPEADRRTAEALHLLGADALYTGAPTRPHAGTIAGLQQNPRYGPLVWMDFSRDPLALDTAVRDTLALIKAGYVELLAGVG